jgi:hypothetical protein
LGLQVMVMNKSGLPYWRTMAMESWYNWTMCQWPPMNEDGNIMSLPRLSMLASLLAIALATPP